MSIRANRFFDTDARVRSLLSIAPGSRAGQVRR